MRRRAAVLLMAAMMTAASVPVGAADTVPMSDVSAVEEVPEEKVIAGFRNMEWGTSFDRACGELQISGLREEVDYYLLEGEEANSIPEVTIIQFPAVNVGGAEAQAGYVFYDEELVMGVYFFNSDSFQNMQKGDLYIKYEEIYGEPLNREDVFTYLRTYSALWADSENNWVILNMEKYFAVYTSSDVDKALFTTIMEFDEEDYQELLEIDVYEMLGLSTPVDEYEGI